MKKYILKNKKDFNLTHIFECGQCFRWNIEDGKYVGVVGEQVISVEQSGDDLVFKSSDFNKLEKTIEEYFNMEIDYSIIKRELGEIDIHLKSSIKYGYGIRILKQDIWETIISFIISANNNIPRIKKIIENLSKTYGREIEFDGKKYYTFPTPQELGHANVDDLRKLGLGFRDKRVYNTTKLVLENVVDIEKLANETDTGTIKENLLKLDGVGEKVADCILLFAYNRYEVFPIDVWVRRVVNELYIKNQDETKVKKQEIQKLALEKFGKKAGLAQQYLFYWKRDNK